MFGLLTWLRGSFSWLGGIIAGVGTSIVGNVAASQAAEAASRLVRIGVWLGIIVVLFNTVTPSYCASLYTCWGTYHSMMGPVAQWIAYFVPVDLLLCLADLYVFGLMIMFCVASVRRVAELGR